ncbi:hypothetical protein ACOME3_005726 [Neoechinorhynchus agilis]
MTWNDDEMRSRNFDHWTHENAQDYLSERISRLKGVTIDIGNEVRAQNEMLTSLQSKLDQTSRYLGRAITRIKRLAHESSPCRFYSSLALICLIVFGFGVFLYKRK